MSQREPERRPFSQVSLGAGGPGGPPGAFRGGPGMGGGGPARTIGRPIEKPKDFWGTFKRLVSYLGPRKWRLTAVFLFAVLSTSFGIFSPKILGRATTEIFRASLARIAKQPDAVMNFPYIINILMTVGILYVLSASFSYVQQYIMAGVAQNTVFDMRRDIDDKLARLPLKYFDSRTHGEILSRVTNDIDNVSATLQQSMTQLITSIVSMCGVVLMMLSINPTLTLVTLVTLPMSVFVTSLIARRSQRYYLGQQRALGELNGHVEEMYTGHKVVKAFGREQDSIGRFNGVNHTLYEYGWKAQFISSMIMPLMHFIQNIGFVIVAVFGGILVTRQTIQIGDVQAFINYSRQFQMPIVQTANIANIIQSTIASAERVFEVLDEKEELPDGKDAVVLQSPEGNVEFHHVSFSYKEDTPLIQDMTLTARPGQTVAIVGPTGAGKTTLVNLVMRFYELAGGSITVDGVNITDIKRGALRKMFGMVLQDTWLFNGTIRANIAYGREGATEEEVVQAAKAARADSSSGRCPTATTRFSMKRHRTYLTGRCSF